MTEGFEEGEKDWNGIGDNRVFLESKDFSMEECK